MFLFIFLFVVINEVDNLFAYFATLVLFEKTYYLAADVKAFSIRFFIYFLLKLLGFKMWLGYRLMLIYYIILYLIFSLWSAALSDARIGGLWRGKYG